MRKNMEPVPAAETSREIWIRARGAAAFSGRIGIRADRRGASSSSVCVFRESIRSVRGFATIRGIDSINRGGLAYFPSPLSRRRVLRECVL
jgi:hypothetical protein